MPSDKPSFPMPFRLADVRNAPETPGIYVWHAVIDLGDADTSTVATFQSAIAAHTAKLRPQALRISANAYFQRTWTGAIEPSFVSPSLTAASRPASASVAEVASQLIKQAQPTFSHPLYIGMARNLRERLAQHADSFMRRRSRLGSASTPDVSDTFADRASQLRLSEDELICQVVPIEGGSLSLSDQEAACALAEYYLALWAAPLLGRK